jgi:hypothetical protein
VVELPLTFFIIVMIGQILKNPAKVKKITEAAFKAIDADGGGYLEKN